MAKWIMVWLVLLYGHACIGQHIPLINYTIDKGFPSNDVYNVYRDKKGYIWFATDIGAVRYNGLKFEHFTVQDGLADNTVFFFTEDFEGRMWIGTYQGGLCFYKDGKFYNAGNTPFLKLPFTPFHTRYISIEPDSSITIYYQDVHNIINIKRNAIQVFKLDEKLEPAYAIYINRVDTGKFELLYNNKRVLIDKGGRILSTMPYKRNKNHKYITYRNGQYLFSDTSLYTIDEQPVHTLGIPMPFNYSEYILSLMPEDSSYFLGTRGGLFTKERLHLLKGIAVSGITTDTAGNYWIATLGSGIYHLSRNYNEIHRYGGAYDGQIRKAQVVNGELYFIADANPGSLQKFDGQKVVTVAKYQTQKHDKGNYPLWIDYVITDSMDYYYFCAPARLVVTDLAKHRQITDKFYPAVADIKAAYTKNNTLFVFKRSAVLAINIPGLKAGLGGVIDTVLMTANAEDYIFSHAEDITGNIWYSTARNTYKIVNKTAVWQSQLKDMAFKKFTFCGNYLVGFNERNHLIICKDPYHAAETDSISNDNVIWSGLYTIDSRHVLISTNKAYFLLTLSSGGLTPKYDLQPVEDPFLPLQAEYICVDSNYCSFFKSGAIYRIATQRFYEKTPEPAIFFTSIQTADSVFEIRDYIEMPYEKSQDIGIRFDIISLASAELKYQYAISTEGSDNWVGINSHEINLHQPGYGSYLVKVRIVDMAGRYLHPAVFHLVILKPYWATWWFRILCIVCVVLLLIVSIRWVVRRRIRDKHQKIEAKIKYQKAEYKALNALMNPHFIFNSINNIQSLINDDNKREANKYLVTFSNLIRQNMHNVSKGLVSMQDEINLTANYLTLEKFRFKDDVSFEIRIDENVEPDSVFIPPLLIQPLVENSIKYRWPHSKVIINIYVYTIGEVVYIQVADNGPGFKNSHAPSKLYPSFSIDNLEKRAKHLQELYGQEISLSLREQLDENNKVQGTIATIKIVLPDR